MARLQPICGARTAPVSLSPPDRGPPSPELLAAAPRAAPLHPRMIAPWARPLTGRRWWSAS